MIKVTVTNTTQAKEIIEAFNDKAYDVEIAIKENTTTENSDVCGSSYGPKYHRVSYLLNKIKKLLEQEYWY